MTISLNKAITLSTIEMRTKKLSTTKYYNINMTYINKQRKKEKLFIKYIMNQIFPQSMLTCS